MSSKNRLQEYCQRHHLANPEYLSECITSLREPPRFHSTVTFLEHTYEGYGPTRIGAEKDAAERACSDIPPEFPKYIPSMENNLCAIDSAIISVTQYKTSGLTQKYTSILDIPSHRYQTIYLIDGDNCHVENEGMFGTPTALFVYFIAKNTTKPFPSEHQQRFENCCTFISDSIGRDAADHLLTFTLGQMTAIWTDKKYIIVTHDHFGECLEKFVSGCRCICAI
jgi:hypothetical protein